MRSDQIRLTQPALKVLRAFLEKPRMRHSGADISKATMVGAGTLYPLLARLESFGWLTSEWEQINPSVVGRPRRRFYLLTGLGQKRAAQALADLQLTAGRLAWTY